MKRAFASSLLLLLLPSYSIAAFTDFDSLVLGTEYSVGETFLSDGLSFDSVNFNGAFNRVRVEDSLRAGGTGLELFVNGLSIIAPVGTQQISLRYRSSDPSTGLIINNVASPLDRSLIPLDGTLLGGVMISAVVVPGTFEQGVLTLEGPISSFVIGGRELWIDDVSVIVPEPSAATLLLIASVITMSRRRRRNIV